jgi:polyisoprenoid-binding protein YceI
MAVWNFDKTHSSANFSVRHMMVTTVRGSFSDMDGVLNFDPANPAAASVEATIKAASINTGVADRDNHLRSADFFDVEKFPTLTFKSTSVKLNDNNSGVVTGDLTIKDVTRPVTLEVEYLGEQPSPFGDRRVGFSATTKINREDFGLTWNVALETGGVLVSKDIKIELDLQAVLATETASA